ncbi:MAG: biopolymer transporter ExbD, partial [Pseudomonadota bacterium]
MRCRESNEAEATIDMAPLIDIVFILLIFFMVTTTFVKDMKLELERPKASSSMAASSKAIRLFIDRNGDTYMDGEP